MSSSRRGQNTSLCRPDVKKDYFTKDNTTKDKILKDWEKVWDKMLAQFIVIDLFSLQKEYIDNRGANSGFESMVHLHNQSYGSSVSSSIIVTIVAWHNTSMLRVWRNHLRQCKSMSQNKPQHSDPLSQQPRINSLSSNLNSTHNANSLR